MPRAPKLVAVGAKPVRVVCALAAAQAGLRGPLLEAELAVDRAPPPTPRPSR